MNEGRGFSQDAHRYLDGEPHGEPGPAARATADRFLHVIAAYRARLEAPGAALDDAVMSAVGGKHHGRAAGRWRWLLEPQTVRLRPVWVPVLAAAAALIIWAALGGRPEPRPAVASLPGSAAADTVFVRFQIVAPEAREVAVAGSFSGWRADLHPLAKEDGGIWSITLPLPLGEHQYQFVIDGTRWTPDPRAYAQVDDGFGGTNSVIIVGPRGVVQS